MVSKVALPQRWNLLAWNWKKNNTHPIKITLDQDSLLPQHYTVTFRVLFLVWMYKKLTKNLGIEEKLYSRKTKLYG